MHQRAEIGVRVGRNCCLAVGVIPSRRAQEDPFDLLAQCGARALLMRHLSAAPRKGGDRIVVRAIQFWKSAFQYVESGNVFLLDGSRREQKTGRITNGY